MIKCPNCEGEMKFDPKSQKIKCEYCGSEFEPGKIENNVKVSEETDSYEGKAYRCSQCGAELLTFDDTAITFCSYCGSQAMIEDKMIKHNNPDFIIPFKKTKEECIKAYKEKVSNFFFAPDSMKSDMTVEKFRGIYMPYGILNLNRNDIIKNTGSKYAYRRGDYVYYNDYQIDTDIDATYEGVSFDLVSKFYDNYSTSIPFDFKEAVSFNSDYLTGYYADSFDVLPDVYEDTATKVVEADAKERLRKNKEFSKYGCSTPKITFNKYSKIGMFPIYFLAIRDKENKNVNYAVINGQTGQVAADLPIDFKKYLFVSLFLTIIIFLLINFFIVETPSRISLFSVITSLISAIISYIQIKKIVSRETHENDKGISALPSNRVRIKYKSLFLKIISSSLIHICGSLLFLLYSISFIDNKLPEDYIIWTLLLLILGEVILNASIVIFRKKNKNKKREKLIKEYGIDAVIKHEQMEKNHHKREFKFLFKEIIAVMISLLPILINAIDDAFYYGASIISLILIVLSFYDLIKEHNLLVSNKLPQLEKRGGDENE